MQASQKLVDFVTMEEGSVSRAYRDPVGIITIGVGHTSAAGGLRVKMGMELSPKQISDLLREDLRKFMARCKIAMPAAKQHEIEGATSFDFNTGAIHKATWVDFWKAKETRESRRRLLLWNKAGGKRLRGLALRREREADIIFLNEWPESQNRAVDIWPSHHIFQQLEKLGYLSSYDSRPSLRPSRTVMRNVVMSFQSNSNLVVDGIVGPATRATMQRKLAAKKSNQAGLIVGGSSTASTAAVDAINLTSGGLIGIGLLISVIALGWVWRNRGRLFGIRAKISNGLV